MSTITPSRESSWQEPHHRVKVVRSADRTKNIRTLILVEATVKIILNILLSVCALSALFKLWPEYQSVQDKLQVITAEVKLTEERVSKERANFSRNFDPGQARSIMQEQSHRLDPEQMPIIWLEKQPIDKNTKDQTNTIDEQEIQSETLD
jgi:hypothetical protein